MGVVLYLLEHSIVVLGAFELGGILIALLNRRGIVPAVFEHGNIVLTFAWGGGGAPYNVGKTPTRPLGLVGILPTVLAVELQVEVRLEPGRL